MHRPSINPKISVSIVFVAGMFMSIMDGTIVNVALPTLSRQFNAMGTSFSFAGFLGLLYATPLFLQQARGVSALTSGLTTFPEAVGILISTQLVTRIYPMIGPRRLIAGGLTGVAIIMALMSLIGHDTDLWLMRALMFLTGAGMAYAFIPVQAAAFATISSAETGHASALFNAQRQIGASFGVALLSTVISAVGITQLSTSGAVVPNFTAYHAAFIAAAVLALTAAFIGLTVRDSDAAATMRRKTRQAKQEIVSNQVLGTEQLIRGQTDV